MMSSLHARERPIRHHRTMPQRTILHLVTVRISFAIVSLYPLVADMILKFALPLIPQRRRQAVDGPAPYLTRTAETLVLMCADSRSVRRHKGVTRPRRAWTRARKQPRRSQLVTAHHARDCTRATVVVSILSAHEPFLCVRKP